MQLLSDGQITDADAKAGVGGVFSLADPAKINHFQHVAVEQSRLHIPILFAYDTIHGYRTIFPVPLGAASSFDPAVAHDRRARSAPASPPPSASSRSTARWSTSPTSRAGAGSSRATARTPTSARCWPPPGSRAPRAATTPRRTRSSPASSTSSAYGQPEGGRDYNTTDMSEQRLRNLYLPPFKAAIDAGADTVMCSFNAINGVPGCANPYTETDILKKEWGFDGFIESDYTAVAETRACPPVNPDDGPCGHGTAADGPEAGANALMAGTDSEMVSTNIRDYGAQLLAQRRITMSRLDDAVRRILRVKFRAGLFEHPYVDQAKAADPASFLTAADRGAARTAAGQLDGAAEERRRTRCRSTRRKKTAVIGPLGNDQHDMLGPWWGRGEDERRGERVRRDQGAVARVRRSPRAARSATTSRRPTTPRRLPSDDGFAEAVAAARPADQVVLALGETREMSGEAAARIDARPARSAAGADRRDQGDREAVRRSCCSTAAR